MLLHERRQQVIKLEMKTLTFVPIFLPSDRQLISESVQMWWVPELPAALPECPPGFMWVAAPCYGGDTGSLAVAAEQAYVGVCDPVLADVAESLPVLECGVFVEPLPDQIALVYEYGEVQAFSWKDVVAGEAREFSLDTADFPDLSLNGDAQRQQDQ